MQNHVRKVRESKKLTLEQVAELLGVTKAQVSKMERGLIRLNDEWLDRLSKLYYCSVHDLIDDDAPIRILSTEKNKKDFLIAPFLGDINISRSGMVEYCQPHEQYSIRCALPVDAIGSDSEFMAFTLNDYLMDGFNAGSQLIFASLNEKNKHLVREGSVLICTQKDKNGNECGEVLRILETDDNGFPYAVFKTQLSRNSFSVGSNLLLTGSIPKEDILYIFNEGEGAKPTRGKNKLQLSLTNREMDIKAILVKSIRNELL